jgi:hypothetical protein
METKKVLAHTCFQRKRGMDRDTPLSPKKCRCRQYLTVEEAAKEVAEGLAQYVLAVDKIIDADQVCHICGNADKLKKSCTWCKGLGIVHAGTHIRVEGQDIIRTVSDDGKRNVLTTKVKKAPTIESGHIYRGLGIIKGNQRASRERWDEYELLTLRERVRLLVDGIVTSDQFDAAWRQWEINPNLPFPLPFRTEPKDNQKEMTGRRYDYGSLT